MKNNEFEYDCLKELGIDEEELLSFVRETLTNLDIPYADIPGKFVIGEKMFESTNFTPCEGTALVAKTMVQDSYFSKLYSYVSIADTPSWSWDIQRHSYLNYSNDAISVA